MDTLQLSPKIRIRMPKALRWVVIGLSFLLVAMTWWIFDLWRVATWSKDQLEMDGALPRRQLAELSLFALFIAASFVATTVFAILHGWNFIEWAMFVFVFTFLYSATTGIRIL